MLTFGKVKLLMEQEEEAALLDSGEDTEASQVIRAGQSLRSEDCGSFWEDFIRLCNNSDSMSQLLNVSKHKVTGWPARIREQLDRVKDRDKDQPHRRKGMVTTGNEPTISPDGLDRQGASPADTRPTP